MIKKKSGSVAGNEWEIIKSILEGKSYTEIAQSISTSESSVRRFVTNTAKLLHQNVETRHLIDSQVLDKAGKKYSWAPTKALDSQVNRKFMTLLSEGDSPVLTEEERTFCYLLVYEGNAKEALKDSGLSVGLVKGTKLSDYNRLLELRVAYLKSKPNIVDYLKELQLKFVETLAVNKSTIQAEIFRTITQLRNQDDPKNAPTIAKLLNDLGRTEGVFIDKQETSHQLNVDDAFDIMVQRRKELSSTEPVVCLEVSPSGTYVCPEDIDEE